MGLTTGVPSMSVSSASSLEEPNASLRKTRYSVPISSLFARYANHRKRTLIPTGIRAVCAWTKPKMDGIVISVLDNSSPTSKTQSIIEKSNFTLLTGIRWGRVTRDVERIRERMACRCGRTHDHRQRSVLECLACRGVAVATTQHNRVVRRSTRIRAAKERREQRNRRL